MKAKDFNFKNGLIESSVKNDVMLVDTKKTKAILIGVQKFKFLEDIEPAVNNVNDLESILTNPKILGLSKNDIHKIIDKRNDEILEEIHDLISDHGNIDIETLIIYYIGHGKRNLSGKFYLTGSNSNATTLSASAVAFEDIKSLVEYSHIQRTIIIIDACYSGIVAQGEELEVKGSYILTSSSANEPSFFDPKNHNTFFTGELIKILNEGIDNQKPFISLDTIFKEIQTKLRQSKPQRKNTLTAKFDLFQNPNYQEPIEINHTRELKKNVDEHISQEDYVPDSQSSTDVTEQVQLEEKTVVKPTSKVMDYQEFDDMIIIPEAFNLVPESILQEKQVPNPQEVSNEFKQIPQEDETPEISDLQYFRVPIILGVVIILAIIIQVIM